MMKIRLLDKKDLELLQRRYKFYNEQLALIVKLDVGNNENSCFSTFDLPMQY